MDDFDSTHITNSSARFPTTQWQVITKLEACTEGQRTDVHDFIIRRYWKPLYYYVRGRGYGVEDGKDLVQDFLANCLVKELFGKANPERGRFRTFLLTCFDRFLCNVHRSKRAQKRRPRAGVVSLEDLLTQADLAYQPPDRVTPEIIFNQTWVRELVVRVLGQLEQECTATGKAVHYELMRRRIIEPALEGTQPPPVGELARTLGLTEKEANNRLTTARRTYQRLLREEIGLFAGSDEEVAAEMSNIFRVLAGE